MNIRLLINGSVPIWIITLELYVIATYEFAWNYFTKELYVDTTYHLHENKYNEGYVKTTCHLNETNYVYKV